MAIKSCIKIVPLVKHLKNFQNSCVSRSTHLPIGNSYKTSFSLCNNIDVRLYSTKSKKEIYYGVLTPQIKAVKIFSLSTSIVGIIAQPFLYNEVAATGNVPIIIAAYTAFGFFTVLTPLLLHFITKKYVTHVEFKEDTDSYVAKTVNFFCLTKETEFTPEDVTVSEVPGMFTTFQVKGQPLFVDPKLFDNPHHYAKIMGYDKPLDLKLYQTSENVDSDSNKKKR